MIPLHPLRLMKRVLLLIMSRISCNWASGSGEERGINSTLKNKVMSNEAYIDWMKRSTRPF
jgi:hypothetical protein